MYSLNVPVPGEVAALATEVARDLPMAEERTRDEHTLLVKRLTGDDQYHRLAERAREALAGQPPFECRVSTVGWFETAVSGSSPVVYLAVESPGLRALHQDLCETFDPVADLEGEEYVPHVTVARGGDRASAKRVVGRSVGPVTWSVEGLTIYDVERGVETRRFPLPA